MADLTCPEAEILISASLDGELSPEEQSLLDSHLAACPACRKAMQEATSLRGLVRASLATPDESLTANVRAAVRASARQRRQSRLVRRASAAAAALLIAAGLAVAGTAARRGNFFADAPNNALSPDRTAPNADLSDDSISTYSATGEITAETAVPPTGEDPSHYGTAAIAGADTGHYLPGSTGETRSFLWQFAVGLLLAAAGVVGLVLLI